MSISTKKVQKKSKSDHSVFRKQENSKSGLNKQIAPAQDILNLHQTIGNQAVQRLFESGFIQRKLTVGEPNDKYEQEADSVADEVMRMPEPQVQRQSEEDEEEEMIQTKPIGDQITPLVQRQVEPEEEEEETLQAKAEGQTPQVAPNLESRINALQGGGQSLSKETRNFFEPRFGRDFSNVKIHTDSNANQMARSINARAFTKGKNIVFGGGEYSPASFSGKRLLGHELTHVVQQHSAADGFMQVPKQLQVQLKSDALQRQISKTKQARPGGAVNRLKKIDRRKYPWMPQLAQITTEIANKFRLEHEQPRRDAINKVQTRIMGIAINRQLRRFNKAKLASQNSGFWGAVTGNMIWAVSGGIVTSMAVASLTINPMALALGVIGVLIAAWATYSKSTFQFGSVNFLNSFTSNVKRALNRCSLAALNYYNKHSPQIFNTIAIKAKAGSLNSYDDAMKEVHKCLPKIVSTETIYQRLWEEYEVKDRYTLAAPKNAEIDKLHANFQRFIKVHKYTLLTRKGLDKHVLFRHRLKKYAEAVYKELIKNPDKFGDPIHDEWYRHARQENLKIIYWMHEYAGNLWNYGSFPSITKKINEVGIYWSMTAMNKFKFKSFP